MYQFFTVYFCYHVTVNEAPTIIFMCLYTACRPCWSPCKYAKIVSTFFNGSLITCIEHHYYYLQLYTRQIQVNVIHETLVDDIFCLLEAEMWGIKRKMLMLYRVGRILTAHQANASIWVTVCSCKFQYAAQAKFCKISNLQTQFHFQVADFMPITTNSHPSTQNNIAK